MTTTSATFPRRQHWRIDGFRISVLVYQSNRHETCRTCGRRGAIHAVWTSKRDDGFDAGPAHFCDQHRPAKGTLPDLDYERVTSDRQPDSRAGDYMVTTERLVPSAAWPCATCGQPSTMRRVLRCGHCLEPEHYTVSTTHVTSITADGVTERTETSIGHREHPLGESFDCEEHR